VILLPNLNRLASLWKFFHHSVLVFILVTRGRCSNRCDGFGVMEIAPQSPLNNLANFCTYFMILCLNQLFKFEEHQFSAEISLLLEKK